MKELIILFLVMSSIYANAQVQEYENFADFEQERLTTFSDDTIYVLNFWATWCVPCVKELPYFDQLSEEKLDKPVKVLLVSLDLKQTVDQHLLTFLKKKEVSSEVVAMTDEDANSWIDKVDPTWTGALPATLIVRNGRWFFFEKSYESLRELKQEIRKTKNNE